MSVAAPSKGPYSELSRIAEAFDVPHAGAASLRLEIDDVRVDVSLDIDSGNVRGLLLSAARSGLPDVIFRRETDSDRKGKERGINVEVQIGDERFDRTVYIETEIPDEAVHAMLADPAGRAAVMDLVVRCDTVTSGPEGIRAGTRLTQYFDPDRFRPLLDSLVLAAKLRAPSFSPLDTKEPSGLVPLTLAAIGAPFSLGILLAGLGVYEPEQPTLFLLGAGIGIVAWAATMPFLPRLVRGHAKSYRYYVLLAVLAFTNLVCGSAALAMISNGGLDTAPPIEEIGRIVAVSHESDEGHPVARCRVAWPARGEERLTFQEDAGPLNEGDLVVTRRRPGRFGYTWIQDRDRPYRGTAGKLAP